MAFFAYFLELVSGARDHGRTSTIGDSHVEFLGPTLGARTESRGGWRASQYAAATDWDVGRVGVVYVVLGTNDTFDSPDTIADSMGVIVDRIRTQAPSADIIWVGPPDLNELRQTDATAEIQRIKCASMHIQWIDSRPIATGEHTPEGIHFTTEGYAIWARGILAQ